MTHEDIVRSLLAYLRSVTACADLAYDEAPARMSGGYDATILSFGLRGAPDPFSAPLVLQLFQPRSHGRRVRPPCRTRSHTWLSGATGLSGRGPHRATRRGRFGSWNGCLGVPRVGTRRPEYKGHRRVLEYSPAVSPHSPRAATALGRGPVASARAPGQWFRRSG